MEARHYPDRDPANNAVGNLSWATPTINQRDRIEHGTSSVGQQNGRALLTEKDVFDMHRRMKERDCSQEQCLERLGREYGVSKSTVRAAIIDRKTWTHLELN